MRSLVVLAVDDEAPALDELVYLLDQHPDIKQVLRAGDATSALRELNRRPIDAVFLKGEHQAAYSGFEGTTADGTGLADWLRARGVDHVDVCGIATDYCVRATVLDARAHGFSVRLLTDLVAGVAPDSTARALTEMREAGAQLA